MKSYWLDKVKNNWFGLKKNKHLIVLFAGWSFDEKPFIGMQPLKDYDVLIVYDYNDLSVPHELKNLKGYQSKTLIAWSMGVFVAHLYKDLFKDFDYKLAVNGTTTPVDDEFGIPIKVFELTLKHAAKGLEEKFYRNIFYHEIDYKDIYLLSPVERPILNRVSELEKLYEEVKKHVDDDKSGFYDMAMVSDYDKIIPPDNQIASHKKNNVPVITVPYGHFPFYCFDNWEELIKCRQTISM